MDKNKREQNHGCHQHKVRATGRRWERTLFTDDKLLTVDQVQNLQTDSTWATDGPATFASSGIFQVCRRSGLGRNLHRRKDPLVFPLLIQNVY